MKLEDTSIVAIMRKITAADYVELADALYAGGIRALEITADSAGAFDGVKAIKSKYGDDLCVGLGTVLTEDQVDSAAACGTDFALSPVTDLKLIDYCLENNVQPVPGAMTPSEAYSAYARGARTIKIFPAGTLGAKFFSSIREPLPFLRLMATGGITSDNIAAFSKAGASMFGVGGSLVSNAIIESEGLAGITARAQAFVCALNDKQ